MGSVVGVVVATTITATLGIVTLIVNVLAGQCQVLLQILALIPAQMAVRPELFFFGRNAALLGNQRLALRTRQLTGTAGLLNALALILLTLVHAGVVTGMATFTVLAMAFLVALVKTMLGVLAPAGLAACLIVLRTLMPTGIAGVMLVTARFVVAILLLGMVLRLMLRMTTTMLLMRVPEIGCLRV